jgi:hypothetical protein
MNNTEDQLILILCRRESGAILSAEEQSIFDDWFNKYRHLLTKDLEEEWLTEIARYQRETEDSWEQFSAMYNPPDRIYLAQPLGSYPNFIF